MYVPYIAKKGIKRAFFKHSEAMEEWQEKILELVRNNQVEDAVSRAEEIAEETGMHDDVARFLIGVGAGTSCRDERPAIMLLEKAETIAKTNEVKELARKVLVMTRS